MARISSEVIQESFSRQQHIVPESVYSTKAAIVGVGAVGRQVALPLSSMGVGHITLVDYDKIDQGNVAMQMFPKSDIGNPKVRAVQQSCTQLSLNPAQAISAVDSQWNPGLTDRVDVIFSCVDSMATRKAIYESFVENPRNKLMLDARMLAQTIRILVIDKELPETVDEYAHTLFSDDEAESGQCTSEGVVYTAAIAGGFLCREFVRWARGDMLIRNNYMIQLQSMDIFDIASEPASA